MARFPWHRALKPVCHEKIYLGKFMLLPISHCVSLGPSCHSAEFLRASGWQRYSLPFDWIHSSPAIVCSVIDDRCEALLKRRDLDSVGPGPDRSGSAPTPRKTRRGMHRRFRTADHAHIFRHHDPAVNDMDFARIHRAADRLRRVLDCGESRTLFLHLETDAPALDSSRHATIDHAHAMFKSLSACSSNFELVVSEELTSPLERAANVSCIMSVLGEVLTSLHLRLALLDSTCSAMSRRRAVRRRGSAL